MNTPLEIKVLGSGCSKCHSTIGIIERTAADAGIEIDIVKVTDPEAIRAWGVHATPAVVVGGDVMHAGGIPSHDAVQAWFRMATVGFLHRPIMAYLRRFHALTHLTLVPTDALRASLEDAGFRRLRVVGRGVDTALFSPSRRDESLRAHWGVGPEDVVACCVGRLAAEKNLPLAVRMAP